MNSLTNMLLNFLPRFPENQFLTKLMVAANSKTFKQKLYSFCHNIKCHIYHLQQYLQKENERIYGYLFLLTLSTVTTEQSFKQEMLHNT